MSLFDRLKGFVDRFLGGTPEPPPPPPPPPEPPPPPPPPDFFPPGPSPEEPEEPEQVRPEDVGTPDRPYDDETGSLDLIWVLDHPAERFEYDHEDWRKGHTNFESAFNYANDMKDKGLPTIVIFDGEEWFVILSYEYKNG